MARVGREAKFPPSRTCSVTSPAPRSALASALRKAEPRAQVAHLCYHNTVLAGASYGLFISYDAGVTWTEYDVVNRNSATYNTSAQRVTSILVDGNTNPSTMYVALGYPYSSTRRPNLIGGANGVYKATVPSSGAPTFTLMASGWELSMNAAKRFQRS